MSGNLFKDSDRIGTALYMFLYWAFKFILEKIGIKIKFLRFPNDKKSHGDMDILCCQSDSSIILPEILSEFFKLLKPLEIKGSSMLYGFAGKKIAVDFLFCSNQENFDTHHFYASFGLTMCIIGKFLSSIGLHLRPEGLYVVRRIGGKDIKYFLPKANEPEEICKVLGLSYAEWVKGFENNGKLVRWILKCKVMGISILSSNAFKKENQDKKNLENGLFSLFVEMHKRVNKYKPHKDISDAILEEFGLMPQYLKDKAAYDEHEKTKQIIKQKFDDINADKKFVKGKKNPLFGKFIKFFKEQITTPQETFEDWLIKTEQAEINFRFEQIFQEFSAKQEK